MRHYWKALLWPFWLVVMAEVGVAQSPSQGLLPQPRSVEWGLGRFLLSDSTRMVVRIEDGEVAERIVTHLASVVREATGARPLISRDKREAARVMVVLEEGVGVSESYRLRVDQTGIVLTAGDPVGLFQGITTLGQLLVPDEIHGAFVPAVMIDDQPRFTYRGMHLDVGRHLFPVAFLKRYLDLLARFKFNTFHWHLTEDQGWRIAIDAYPRLTEVGGCRAETIVEKNFDPFVGDGTPYCGFYTQDEIREVVAYAADRFITVIPEIEMPGHSLAALAAYPEYACTQGPFEVGTRWGVYEDIYCPSEATFAFLEDVLVEVMALFPSPYIHIGGDEAPKRRWRESELAQDVMRREGLEDEAELQSYFIRRIERFLNAHGRRLIGWDEILEGGVAPDATVMSWRGMAGGIEAARQGHDVIMTPGSHVYFDHYQGDPRFEPLAIGGYTPLEKVYHFEPVPAELTGQEAGHVIGAQANVWTEYMRTSEHVEYMALPRMLALAEVLWSPAEARDWDSFRARLPARLRDLDRDGIGYRVPEVEGLADDRLSLEPRYRLGLGTLMPEAVIRYTLDGSDPSATSPVYTDTLVLEVNPDGVVVTARTFLPNRRTSPAQSATIRRTTLRAALEVDTAGVVPGIQSRLWEGRLRTLEGIDGLTLVWDTVASSMALPEEPHEEFALRFDGLLRVEADAVYQFELLSDDGSRLWLDGELVIDHDGLHSARAKRGMVALAAGFHRLRVEYFQAGGGRTLDVRMRREPDGAWSDLDGRLFHTAE